VEKISQRNQWPLELWKTDARKALALIVIASPQGDAIQLLTGFSGSPRPLRGLAMTKEKRRCEERSDEAHYTSNPVLDRHAPWGLAMTKGVNLSTPAVRRTALQIKKPGVRPVARR
jgi:hypothetical protein